MLTKVYFVRHAQPVHSYADDRTRPLTEEGIVDSKLVLQTLKDKNIEVFYCSPYKRSLDTIRESADYYEMNIQTDERLREREAGVGGSVHGMYQKRWANHNFHEDGGESIGMVQKRNIEALKTILKENEGKNIVIGTHGTALSSIINYYLPEFGCDDFLRIIDWMPYIVEIDFEGQKLISIHEHAHIEKKFKKDNSANKQ
jgi:2,3-bisphosphoglycerate-dependent phosphoglycerate mutase